MTRQLLAILLALSLAFQAAPALAQVRAAAPVEVPVSAAAAVGANLIPIQLGGVFFQSQVTALTSLHAAQITALAADPGAAARYLESQRVALPADAQAAAAQLASLALVTRALARSGPATTAAAPAAAVAQQLAAMSLAVREKNPGAATLAPLLDTASRINRQAEPALQIGHLFDGAGPGVSEGARLAEGGWRTPMATRLAAELPLEAAAIHRLPPGLREKVMGLKSQREAMRERMRDLQRKGMDLQSWGIPNVVSIDREKALRYARIYRMNGLPTDVGLALHEALAPLIEADKTILARITSSQLHEATQVLAERLAYRMQPDSDDMQMQARLLAGAKFDEGFDYPEQRRQLMEEAREILRSPPAPGEAPAGLGEVAPEDRPAVFMVRMLAEASHEFAELQKKLEAGEVTEEELKAKLELLLALHAAMGLPLQSGPGEMALVQLKHEQLRPLVAELTRREASDAVLGAVVRSFPLGESLWRLGVHKLWEKGLTGKGIKVAVVDNGVDFGHPDLQGSGRIFENMTFDRGDHTKGGHGTPMASIIHAIAPDAEIQSYQAWSNAELPGVVMNNEESLAATLKALDRAKENGAQIINISGGFPMGYSSDTISKKIAELTKQGITVVVSAGNEGDDLPNGAQVRSPATSPDAIAVGAVDYHEKKARFSSGGRVFTRGAVSTVQRPDIAAFGVMIKGAAQLPAHIYQAEPAPYMYGSGTSPAAPHVSGVAALMLQASRDAAVAVESQFIPKLVKQALVASAKLVGRLPVMVSAQKAVDAFLAAVRPAA